jgi:hypothetical protein
MSVERWSDMAKYRHLSVKKVALADFAPEKRAKELTPRQRATLERDDEVRAAMNEAASLPASEAVAIELKPDQKMPTIRAAVARILNAEPRDLNWGVRGNMLLISKGAIPARGGRLGGSRESSGARTASPNSDASVRTRSAK